VRARCHRGPAQDAVPAELLRCLVFLQDALQNHEAPINCMNKAPDGEHMLRAGSHLLLTPFGCG